METLLAFVLYFYMGCWTISGLAHAYAIYEEARLNRVVADLNAAAAEYLRTHAKLPEAHNILTLK